ncbi:hypothetical protein, partial [uncultured Gammaproteobacteria bacterium]
AHKKIYYCWTFINDFTQRIGTNRCATSANQQLQTFCRYCHCCPYFRCNGLLSKTPTTSL